MKLSFEPPYMTSIARLDRSTRHVVVSLVGHPIVDRLKQIYQLGFTHHVYKSATHTRWEHTMWTVHTMCEFLRAAPALPREAQQHLLAAVIVQDVGHSAFSNSLSSMFRGNWGQPQLSEILPSDKLRTLAILQMAEESEGLFRRLGLLLEVITQLVVGKNPWPRYRWVQTLMEGVLDVDRLAYVAQDSLVVDKRKLEPLIRRVASSIVYDGPPNITIIASGSEDDVTDFLLARGALYLNVYCHTDKFAWERIVRDVLEYSWHHPQLGGMERPKSVDEFLLSTDATVEKDLDHLSLPMSPLSDCLRLLARAEIFVAEVINADGRQSSFEEIDRRLLNASIRTFPSNWTWVVLSTQLPSVSVFETGSILIKDRSSYLPIEAASQKLSEEQSFTPRPMVITSADQIGEVTKALFREGLSLTRLHPIMI